MQLISLARDLWAGRPAVPRSPLWAPLAHRFLAEHSLCCVCGKPATVVHHKKPFHLFPELELVWENLAAMDERRTFSCHLWVGHCGDFKTYRHDFEQAADLVRQGLLVV